MHAAGGCRAIVTGTWAVAAPTMHTHIHSCVIQDVVPTTRQRMVERGTDLAGALAARSQAASGAASLVPACFV